LLSVIGTGELLFRTQEIVGRNFMTLEFYGLCGILFFIVNWSIERLGKLAGRHFALQ
jgi:polar amino acid transport system permease protein